MTEKYECKFRRNFYQQIEFGVLAVRNKAHRVYLKIKIQKGGIWSYEFV